MDLPAREEISLVLRLAAMMEPTRAVCMSLCCALAGRMTLYQHGNNHIMMCMDGTGPELSKCLLTMTEFGECHLNYCAECIDPHTCGDKTTY